MKSLLALLFLVACAFAADDSLSRHEFRMTQLIVKPKNLKDCAVPFAFEIAGEDSGLIRIHVTISTLEKSKGTAESAALVVTTIGLPVDDARDVVWVYDAARVENQKKIRIIDVPSAKKRIVEDFFVLSRADAEKSAIRVHYQQPSNGGEDYWILIGRFLKPANQALQHNDPSCHVSCLRTPRASRGRG